LRKGEWNAFRDGEIPETVHCNEQDRQGVPIDGPATSSGPGFVEDKSLYRYHAIASNRPSEHTAVTMEWYSQRGDASENRVKDLKVGFGREYMPCGSFRG
jgi:hypothetical protein